MSSILYLCNASQGMDILSSVRSDLLRHFFEFLNTDEVSNVVEGFIQDNCSQFDPEFFDGDFISGPTTKEHRLEYQELHIEYKRLIDRLMGRFCRDHSVSQESLLKECDSEMSNPQSLGGAILEMFLSAQDYESFCRLMVQESKRYRDRMREEKKSPKHKESKSRTK